MQPTMRTNWRTATWACGVAIGEFVPTRSTAWAAVAQPHLLLLFPDTDDVSGELVIVPNEHFGRDAAALGAPSIQLDPTLRRDYRGHALNAPEALRARALIHLFREAATIGRDEDPFGYLELEAHRNRADPTKLDLVVSAAGSPVGAVELVSSHAAVSSMWLLDENEEWQRSAESFDLRNLPEPVSDSVNLLEVVDHVRDVANQSGGWLDRLRESCPCMAHRADSLIFTEVVSRVIQTGDASMAYGDDELIAEDVRVQCDRSCGGKVMCATSRAYDDERVRLRDAGLRRVATAKAPPPQPAAELYQVGW